MNSIGKLVLALHPLLSCAFVCFPSLPSGIWNDLLPGWGYEEYCGFITTVSRSRRPSINSEVATVVKTITGRAIHQSSSRKIWRLTRPSPACFHVAETYRERSFNICLHEGKFLATALVAPISEKSGLRLRATSLYEGLHWLRELPGRGDGNCTIRGFWKRRTTFLYAKGTKLSFRFNNLGISLSVCGVLA